MRHLGKKRLSYVKKLFILREKHVYYYFQREKRLNLRFPTLLSFSISLTGPIPLRIQFLLLLPKRKIPFFSLFTLLSLSLYFYACHSLFLSLSPSFSFLSRFMLAPEFRDKRKKKKLMMWLSHSMICFALFCYRVSFCQLVVDCSFLFTL